MLPPIIAKLIPRLASEHDGETIAVRDAIAHALSRHRLDWHDLARACMSARPLPAASPKPCATPAFGDMARACRDLDDGRLTDRERVFVAEMCRLGFSRQPSPRQAEWLSSIFDRLQRRAA
jgi:hypothetical protein